MPAIDVVDSTWFAARPSAVAALVAEPGSWRRWWPELTLQLDEWRGDKGVRWLVSAVAGTGRRVRLSGSAEVWLEPMFDGVVAHVFLRLDGGSGPAPARRTRERIARRFRLRTKQAFWRLGDQLDAGRVARHTSTSHASGQ